METETQQDSIATDVLAAVDHAMSRKQLAIKALALRCEVAELDLRIRRQEASIKAAIAAELTDEGKPLYSNDVKRDAEFIARAQDDEALRGLRADRDEKDFAASAVGFDAQFHADMIRVLCAFAQGEPEAS